jgi:hypothetical protein
MVERKERKKEMMKITVGRRVEKEKRCRDAAIPNQAGHNT